MIKKEKITELVQQKIAGTGIFIVYITVGGNNRIFVRVDKPTGISLEECRGISIHIEGNLDREVEDFELEVSSPGIGEPFKVKEQYLKSVGKNICVVTKEGEKKNGLLINFSDGEIEIEAEEKSKNKGDAAKKETRKNIYKYNINNIAVKEVISFK